MRIRTNSRTLLLALATALFSVTSCTDYLSTDLPDGELSFEEGIQTQEDLEEMVNSIYDVLANSMGGQAQRLAELVGEDVELIGNTGDLIQIYNRSTDFFNGAVGWYREPYFVIYRANTLLEQIDRVSIDSTTAAVMRGEAYALRAYAHMELVKLFAQPYGYTSDNSHAGIVVRTSTFTDPIPRNTVGEVYDQIEADLLLAATLLPDQRDDYNLDGAALAGLLARMYHYQGNYAAAAVQADLALELSNQNIGGHGSRYAVDEQPADALFYIVSTSNEDNRAGGWRGDLSSDFGVPTLRAAQAVDDLLADYPQDVRQTDIDTLTDAGSEVLVYTKFNELYFNTGLVNVTEIYYILAESLLRTDAPVDRPRALFNKIRTRNGIPPIEFNNRTAMIDELLIDKRKEFLGEGINVFDLKRRGAIHGENIVVRGAPWNCDGMILQFPASELTVEFFELNPEGGCN